MFDQWTRYSEHVLDLITVDRQENDQNHNIFDFPKVYPFRVCDISLPTDQTGYVYCLVLKRYMDHIYIGTTETECLTEVAPTQLWD